MEIVEFVSWICLDCYESASLRRVLVCYRLIIPWRIHFHLERVRPRYSKHRGFCLSPTSLRFYGDSKWGRVSPCRSSERRRLIVGNRVALSSKHRIIYRIEGYPLFLSLSRTRQSFRMVIIEVMPVWCLKHFPKGIEIRCWMRGDGNFKVRMSYCFRISSGTVSIWRADRYL